MTNLDLAEEFKLLAKDATWDECLCPACRERKKFKIAILALMVVEREAKQFPDDMGLGLALLEFKVDKSHYANVK